MAPLSRNARGIIPVVSGKQENVGGNVALAWHNTADVPTLRATILVPSRLSPKMGECREVLKNSASSGLPSGHASNVRVLDVGTAQMSNPLSRASSAPTSDNSCE